MSSAFPRVEGFLCRDATVPRYFFCTRACPRTGAYVQEGTLQKHVHEHRVTCTSADADDAACRRTQVVRAVQGGGTQIRGDEHQVHGRYFRQVRRRLFTRFELMSHIRNCAVHVLARMSSFRGEYRKRGRGERVRACRGC